MSALALAAIVLLADGLLQEPAGAATSAGDCTPGAGWPALRGELGARAIQLVNAHRTARGLRALVVSPRLTTSAEWKARHLAQYGYLAHADPAPPVARSAAERIAACGYRAGWGENVAAGFATAEAVVAAWLASDGHRANVENGGFAAIGSAAAAGPAGVYWVQDFGTVADAATQPQPPARLTLHGLRVRPRPPHANGRLTGTVAVRLGGRSVAAGRVLCRGRIAGRPLRVLAHRFAGGRARCVWRVPRGTRGKLIRASIGVARGGRAVSAPFRARVR